MKKKEESRAILGKNQNKEKLDPMTNSLMKQYPVQDLVEFMEEEE